MDSGFGRIEDFLNESWKTSKDGEEETESNLHDSPGLEGNFCARKGFIDGVKTDAARVLEILHQDGPGFDAKPVLSELGLRVSSLLVREVLFRILKEINYVNKNRCAKLGYKFFVWSGEQENYKHTVSIYHVMMDIFAESEEFKAMWRLVDEMTEKGYPTTARTFNILICTCGEAGIARKIVERFIKSKTFNYRPFKHSYSAILHSLLTMNQYRLVEWVYQQMLAEGHTPDVFTYNIIMCAKFRLGKLEQFHMLLDEMGRSGFSPDLHTFNLLLHVLGKGDKPLAALKLLNHMKEAGVQPGVLHFTTLIDGLSRAGNLEACEYFLNEMMTKHGCLPDVVCYTVMITGYVVSGNFDSAQKMFDEMIKRGHLPNVFTYNSMIRGFCMERRFEEAWLMLKGMELRGCNPNFLVYTTLVGYLRNAGKLREAHEVIKHMVEKGQYGHLLSKIKRYRRC
ncbi:pentatricopeptide repeat-containing protein [Striga asiatica]|uniref:Pentatricopeptide repeat-containing protein n=1 Tax=Striga asiatica TaxID=4170 RepID=A0A5A7R0X6_STRAF|nr:pentatricopeptide repeat-containing protein [Striga asiatica]